ncbi:unnamed protein product [Linum trigynum]
MGKNHAQSKQVTADETELYDETELMVMAEKISEMTKGQAKLIKGHGVIMGKLDQLRETIFQEWKEARVEKSINALKDTLIELFGRITRSKPSETAADAPTTVSRIKGLLPEPKRKSSLGNGQQSQEDDMEDLFLKKVVARRDEEAATGGWGSMHRTCLGIQTGRPKAG